MSIKSTETSPAQITNTPEALIASENKQACITPTKMKFGTWRQMYTPDLIMDGESSKVRLYGINKNDLELIEKADPRKVWTLLSVGRRNLVVNGWHYVNREGYFLTDKPFLSEGEEFLEIPFPHDPFTY
jgi:hypothetical protein